MLHMPKAKIKLLFTVHTVPKMQSMEMKAQMLSTNIQCMVYWEWQVRYLLRLLLTRLKCSHD